jgi:hypothetical protein
VIDSLSSAILAVVVLLLAFSLCLQFVVAKPGWLWLDNLAIVPQWKFFGQARIATDQAVFDDVHLLVRSHADGRWQQIGCCPVRAWHHAFWNPHLPSDSAVLVATTSLAEAAIAGNQLRPSSLAYLTVLRFCLDRVEARPDDAVQFAIVTTRGRTDRQMFLRFLSAWHRP